MATAWDVCSQLFITYLTEARRYTWQISEPFSTWYKQQTSDLEKANLLNKVFINSFNHSTPVLESTDLPSTDPNGIPEPLMCTEDEVFEMLSTLDTTKSSGHDEISTKMLKETALSMTPAVTELFSMLISLGVLPDEWKNARVYPLFPSHLAT